MSVDKGTVVKYWSRRGGWHFGRYVRTITKGRKKGHHLISLYGGDYLEEKIVTVKEIHEWKPRKT